MKSHRQAAFHRGSKNAAKKGSLFDLVRTVDKKHHAKHRHKVTGTIELKVAKEGKQVSLPQIEQRSLFLAMDQRETSLAKMGFKYWRPTPAGFNFLKHPPSPVDSFTKAHQLAGTDDDMVVCEASDVQDKEEYTSLKFTCTETMDKMRFAKADENAKDCPWGYVDPTYYGAYYNPMSTGWIACPNGAMAPYGWQQGWPQWQYQYYILSPYGYYGCNSLNGVYCADQPYYYATTIEPQYVVG